MASRSEHLPTAAAARNRAASLTNPADGGDLARVDQAPAVTGRAVAPEVQFDVTVIGGEAGRRLAVLQAEVILDILTWLYDHRPGATPASARTRSLEGTARRGT